MSECPKTAHTTRRHHERKPNAIDHDFIVCLGNVQDDNKFSRRVAELWCQNRSRGNLLPPLFVLAGLAAINVPVGIDGNI